MIHPVELHDTGHKAKEIELSLPEVSALCARAARGVGWSWGMAEECGAAAVWLACRDYDWASIILSCLRTPAGGVFAPTKEQWQTTEAICRLHAGVTLAEFATLPEGPSHEAGVTLGPVQNICLLLPFVMRAAARLDTVLAVECNGTIVAEIDPKKVVFCNAPQGEHGTIRVCQAVDRQPPTREFLRHRAQITSQQKAALDSFAMQMTVPSSAVSQARAGGDAQNKD